MSPAIRRAAIVVAGVAVLVVAFLLLSGGKDDSSAPSTASTQSTASTPSASGATKTSPSAAPAVPTVRVVDAKAQGGLAKLEFKKGDEVRFRVVSDTADEIHVHGYDIHKDVAKGGSVTFAFPGSIEGRFVVELEAKGVQIAQLDVVP